MSDSFGINLKAIIIWPNNNRTCYEIAIAKETNITAIFQGKLLGCLATEIFYGLRYGFKWQSGSQIWMLYLNGNGFAVMQKYKVEKFD